MKQSVTENQRQEKRQNRKYAEKLEKQYRHKKTKAFQEVYIHTDPAVVQLLGFHNNSPAFLPLDASVRTTQHNTAQQRVKRSQSHGQCIWHEHIVYM